MYIIRLLIPLLLLWIIFDISIIENNFSITFEEYIYNSIFNIFNMDTAGSLFQKINIYKMFAVISLFFISFLQTIFICSDLSNGARDIIRFHSKNNQKYNLLLLKIFLKIFFIEYLIFIFELTVSYYFFTKNIPFFTKQQIFYFLIILWLFIAIFSLIILISKNAMFLLLYYWILLTITPFIIIKSILLNIVFFIAIILCIFTPLGRYLRREE